MNGGSGRSSFRVCSCMHACMTAQVNSQQSTVVNNEKQKIRNFCLVGGRCSSFSSLVRGCAFSCIFEKRIRQSTGLTRISIVVEQVIAFSAGSSSGAAQAAQHTRAGQGRAGQGRRADAEQQRRVEFLTMGRTWDLEIGDGNHSEMFVIITTTHYSLVLMTLK
jgi:hypothetical protein